MPKTPDRIPGVSDEEGIMLSDEGVQATVEGEIRYTAGRFSFFDSSGGGEFDPRSGLNLDDMIVDDVTGAVLTDDVLGTVLVNS